MEAVLSMGLAKLVETVWPVYGYEAALTAVAESKPVTYEVDSPDARVNLRLYLRRMTAYADGLGVAMWERFDDFERAILLPVWVFSIRYAMVMSASWGHHLKSWANLLRDPSASYSEVIQQVEAEAR